MGVNFYDFGIGEFAPGRSISHYYQSSYEIFINSSETTSDSYDNSVRVDEFELHHMYHLHSPANQFYAWSLHIDYDETGGDWAVPIDPV